MGSRTRNPLREPPHIAGSVRLVVQAMRRPSLLSQIVALNLLMVTAGIFVASIAAGLDFSIAGPALAVPGPGDGAAADVPAQHAPAAAPLRAARAAAGDDGAGRPLAPRAGASSSTPSMAGRLDRHRSGWRPAFNRMLERLESERRRSGRAGRCGPRRRSASASRATCTTRSTSRSRRCCCASRPPPQDAPPELQAELAETKQLANQAMGELLDLARQLRPTALDDHGLVAALRTHVRDYDRRGPARASFWADPALGELSARRRRWSSTGSPRRRS